jgi:hypothetical protein
MTTERTWKLTDHLCIHCGGRILLCVTGNGMTPGGDPIRKCCQCGKESTREDMCWCSMSHRGQTDTPYRCLPFSILKEHPEYEVAFRACGCDPKRGEVGVVLNAQLRDIQLSKI